MAAVGPEAIKTAAVTKADQSKEILDLNKSAKDVGKDLFSQKIAKPKYIDISDPRQLEEKQRQKFQMNN